MQGDVTELLIAHGAGAADALPRLVPLVYEDLRRIARVQLRGRKPDASLDSGALVHEAYLRLIDQARAGWNDRRHFFAVAAIAMRQIAVDRARRRARNGRWLAYQSDESGRFEIYVRTFPEVDAGRWQVSRSGGTSPRWAGDGRSLFYYDGRGIIAVPIVAGARFESGAPVRLFDYAPFSGRMGPDYDVTRDGSRFLMIRSAADTPSTRVQLVLVQNWIAELRAKLGRAGFFSR